MRKFCIAFVFALVVCAGSSFAFSSDDNIGSFSVSAPARSVGDYMLDAVSYASTSAGWSDTDHDYLNQIRLALTSTRTGTLLSYIIDISDSASKSYDKLFAIKQNTDYLQNINNNGNSILSYLRNDINGPVIRDSLTAIKNNTTDIYNNTHDISSILSSNDIVPHFRGGSGTPTWYTSIPFNMGYICTTLLYDDVTFWNDGAPTLFGLVHRLQKTLASDEDIALAEAQKTNRQQIEQDFVSGSSGKTSLGASDFGDLSSVGGSVKDSISLNGQSSIVGFTGGLNDANDAGQGWFSAATRDALDSVSSSSPYGLKREKGNSDIYNMAGFSDHYSWLYGD